VSARRPNALTIERRTFTERQRVGDDTKLYAYDAYAITGWLNGKRVRRQAKTHAEAILERERLEIEAAAAAGQLRTVVTRLSDPQVRTAETVFELTSDPLAAIQWYLANYRPPCVDKLLTEARDAFLDAMKPNVEAVHWTDTRIRLNAFCAAFPSRIVHTIRTAEVEAYLNGQGWAPKTFNNTRGALSAFFDFCRADDRRWTESNPIARIKQKKVTRGLPQIETADKIAKLFAFLEAHTGGPRRPHKPGFLVPYFALATFAGMRPSVPDGEIWKLGVAKDRVRLLNLATGVIHVTPEIAKTDDIRAVKIRPNLAAWLKSYPLEDYPIIMPNMPKLLADVRKEFGLGDDVLRHTMISAHVAKFRSIGEAAIEAGNSESIIRAHYLNVMSEDEANAFWSIVPRKAG